MKRNICAVLLVGILGAASAFAQSTAQEASAQFRAAEKLEAALKEQAEAGRSRAEYLKVIRAYERVYLITPHTAWADNALTSIARLYEEIKEPKNAVKTLQFLLQDYPQTPFRDVATRDIARLNGPSAAEAVPVKDAATVENIRFSEEERPIRVVVDLAGSVSFREGEAKSPDRYFIDIFPAKLNPTLIGKEWQVDAKALQKIRVAPFDASTVRIVLDGTIIKNVATTNLKDSKRLTLDVSEPRTPAAPATSSSPK